MAKLPLREHMRPMSPLSRARIVTPGEPALLLSADQASQAAESRREPPVGALSPAALHEIQPMSPEVASAVFSQAPYLPPW